LLLEIKAMNEQTISPSYPNLCNRVEAAAYLTKCGYPIAPKTLAKFASLGKGPRYRIFGRETRYNPADLIAWAESKTALQGGGPDYR
jgi:hypothetical protein